MRNILIYLDPSFEFNNPNFRYTSFKNSILPQAKLFSKAGNKVFVFVGSSVAEKAIQDNWLDKSFEYIVADSLNWNSIGNTSVVYSQNDEHREKEEFEREFLRLWGDRSAPEYILVWEAIPGFLGKIFPKSKIVYQTPGFFSRPPYPQLIMNNKGLLNRAEGPDTRSVDAQDLESVDNYRKQIKRVLSTVCPFNEKIIWAKKKFKHIVVFPLQVDGYFMVDTQIRGRSQLDLVVDILSRLPKDCCLVVTDYVSKDVKSSVILEETKILIQAKYKNLIFDNDINKTFCSSQFLVPEVDGVVTISSSVGLQAAFWRKPLYVFGSNYVSYFKTADSVINLIRQLGSEINRDDKVVSAIKSQNVALQGVDAKSYFESVFYEKETDKCKWLCGKSLGEFLKLYSRGGTS